MIYLDNSATTKPSPEVLKSFQSVNERFFANPSSIHEYGGETEKLLTAARKQVSHYFQVDEEEIIFTSGGTEGNNLAIQGIAHRYSSRGNHIITTEIEHPSVYETCHFLENNGFTVTYLPVDRSGQVQLEDLKRALTDKTILVSIAHVNSEIGVVQNIHEIGEFLKSHPKVFFHVDHVQGLGKRPLFPREAFVDLCTVSGHKIHGLKGTGVLYVRRGVQLEALFHGGVQERAVRPGTENVAGAVSFAKALRMIQERYIEEHDSLVELGQTLIDGLSQLDAVLLNTNPSVSIGHIVNFSIPGLKPEIMIHTLGKKNIYISTKSACSSRDEQESRIVAACYQDPKRSMSALRVSLSYDNTEKEIEIFLTELKEAIQQLQHILE